MVGFINASTPGNGGLAAGMMVGDYIQKKRKEAQDREIEQNRLKGLASGFLKVRSGDDSGWDELANADPNVAMNMWNSQQKLNQDNTFGVGSAKGEYAQLLALDNDPNTSPEMKERIRLRMGVLEKDPNIAYENSVGTNRGKVVGQYEGKEWEKGQKGWTNISGQNRILKGSEAERDWLKENNKLLRNNEMAIRAGKTVISDIQALKRLYKENPGSISGFSASMTNFIPGTVAADAKARADSIKGNIAVDNLLNIKQSGAGLGQVPQSQADMLSGLFGSLSQTQNDREFMDTLDRIEQIYSEVIKSAENENKGVYDVIYNPNESKVEKAKSLYEKYGLEE